MKPARFTIVLWLSCCCVCNSQLNPYKVLNVHKRANLAEIRKSYKSLVKEWHPDKNDSPDAQEKFIEIQQAYEILSNDEKRKQYDSGSFTMDSNQQSYQQWTRQSQHFKFSFGGDFFDFDFGGSTSERSVSSLQFQRHMLPNSHHTPQVLYVYSTFCGPCINILRTTWEKTATSLENLGLGVGTVDSTFSSRLASHLRVQRVPTIVMIFEEEYFYYQGVIVSDTVKNFVARNLPQHFVTSVSSANIDTFLNGVTTDDKPRALLFSKQNSPTILYNLMAIKHQKYIRFGFASLKDPDADSLVSRYAVDRTGPTLLIFNEDNLHPVVTLQSSDMPRGAINDVLTLHHHMKVPRVLSQDVFDDVCPPPKDLSHHLQLCAIYATNDKHDNYATSLKHLRQAVKAATHNDEQLSDWLKFMFLIDHKQQAFVKSLSGSDTLPQKAAIYLIWRRSAIRGFSTTFSGDFLDSESTANSGFQNFVAATLKSSQNRRFQREVRFSPITDELAPYIWTRLHRGAWKSIQKLWKTLSRLSEQEAMLLFITIFFIFLSIYSRLCGKKKRPSQPRRDRTTSEDEIDVDIDVSYADEESDHADFFVKDAPSSLQELDSTTYENLILRQARGHIAVVVLLNKSDHVIGDFIKVMNDHQRDTKLHFAFLKMTSYLGWYVELRKTSSAVPPHKQEGPNGCDISSLHVDSCHCQIGEVEIKSALVHGTVLAINGSKHWYCLFVPRFGRARSSPSFSTVIDDMVPPADDASVFLEDGDGDTGDGLRKRTGSRIFDKMDNPVSCSSSPPDGASEYYDSLYHWMCRVCEGQLPRLYVRQWPGLYLRNQATMDEDDDD